MVVTMSSMKRPSPILLTALLVGVLFAPMGLARPHLAAHTGDQSHHHAGTHSSLLCAWLCAAGYVVDAIPQRDRVQFMIRELVDSARLASSHARALARQFSRGPPTSTCPPRRSYPSLIDPDDDHWTMSFCGPVVVRFGRR
ncbi:hypothetical protein NSPZN2_100411 [Nitrospira defluvii]|uniref:Uncharacterized protein n=1 Tax=Nitrospira defluvii TaxID=330214 RepID=A0ABM8R4J8_9BACT|nr:hypothetical protein NSPZN2_100411 [Nitrospira defluvii]